MNTQKNALGDQPGWILLILQSLLIGAFTGMVVGGFRYLNDSITQYFVLTVGHSADKGIGLAVAIFAALFIFAMLSILYLRWERLIGGSGIPQVEIMIHGDLQMNWWRVLLTKFLGALTSLAGGLSLGREGPCIMMGASLGVAVGRIWHSQALAHARRFLAAGAAAGLAAAFGAPIAGVLFIFEEVRLPLRLPLIISCVLASFTAVWLMQALFEFPLVFPLSMTELLPVSFWWLVVLIAVVMGVLGVGYNRLLIALTYWADRTRLLPMHLRVFMPFFISGLLLYSYPNVLAGFGISALQLEYMALPLIALLTLLIIKMLFSVVSYSSGVVGGLLMPILLIGALAGANLIAALKLIGWVPESYVGVILAMTMAAFFGASIRAPLTGSFLMIEMTGSYTNAVFIIVTAYTASWVANRLHSEPVYETLRERAETMLLKKSSSVHQVAQIER